MISLFSMLLVISVSSNAAEPQKKSRLTVEEQRVSQANKAMPVTDNYFDNADFKTMWSKVNDFNTAKQLLSQLGEQLWQYSKSKNQLAQVVDDRPLYWSRLALKGIIKSSEHSFSKLEIAILLEVFEKSSRGYNDLFYTKNTDKRILLTGFDPFLLDTNIKQSNPSGLTALLLDGMVIQYQQGDKIITAEINAAIVPVRFEDFDQGEIENLLAPFYATNSVDMIATISMGRSDFDLEHFPGLRRSATAPDNLNIYTGANKINPLIPDLSAAPLNGEEFVTFSLPYKVMMQAKGPYKVNDNRGVTILIEDTAKNIVANDISDLADKTSVQGGGGGYLSNEISYRSIVLRNKLGSSIPTGHIHTPRINSFDEKTNQAIVEQIKVMLGNALTEI